MAYAKVNKPLTPDYDFIGNNPWFKITPPYSDLIRKFGDEIANKYLIAIFLMCDPDEDANPFFRMEEGYKKEVIKENYVDIDWSDDTITRCLDSYPFDCMDSIERAFKEEKEQIIARAKFIKSVQYKLSIPEQGVEEEFDKTVFDAQVKAISLVESMQKNTEAVYKQYERVEEKFIKGKTSATARGGRRLTKAEKREI